MKSHLIETWGVYLGRAVWMMGGWLVIDAKGQFVEWTWHYTNIRELLEEYWSAKPGGMPIWT